MARELSIEVSTPGVEQAKSNLGQVETAIQGVEKAADKASPAVDKTTDALDRTGKSSGVAAEGLRAVVARLGGPLGIAGLFIGATKAAMSYADSMDDVSKKTGIGVVTLQKWDHIAKLNGSTMEAMTRAANRLGADLTQGDKSVVAGIQRMGLSVEDLLRMNPEDRFRAVAQAIGSIEDPAKRAAAAEDILKRQGLELLGVIEDLADGTEKHAPAIGEEWIKTGAMMQDAFDTALAHAKNLATYMVLSFPKSMMDGVNAWKTALQSMGLMDLPAPPVPDAPNLPGAQLPKFDPLGGRSMKDIEDELTKSTQQLIRARTGAAASTVIAAEAEHELITRSAANAWLVGARGPNMTGAFPWTVSKFPGFASPDPLQTTGWQPPWAQFPGAPGMHAPGGRSGGSFWANLMKNPFMGMGLGMLPGLLPGMSGRGASLGSGLGGALGGFEGISKALGGFASFLGPIGGIVGGLFGKLFGPSEKDKTAKSRQGLIDQFGGFDELAKAASEAGFNLDKMFSTTKVKDFEKEVQKLNKALNQQEEDTQRLDAAMEKYGFTIEDMGDKFQQTEVNKGFKELGEDFRVLIEAGADFNTVAEKMAPTFGSLIQTAIETGSTVPRELEPIIKKMIDMGVLVDRNGDKFTDLSQVPFAESMTQGFDRVVAAIEKLTEVFGDLNGVIDRTRGSAEGLADTIANMPTPDITHGDPDAVQVSRGGVIRGRGNVLYFNRGGFVPRGSDTVPAMLTPGEMVISRDMVRNLAQNGDRVREHAEVAIVVVNANNIDEAIEQIKGRFGRWVAGNEGQIRAAMDQLYQPRERVS